MTKSIFIKLCGIEIPVDTSRFITPDWKEVLDFHAAWVQQVDWTKHGDPWPFQPYMLEYAKELAKCGFSEEMGDRTYKTADDIVTRCLQHYGLEFLEHYSRLNTVP